MLNVEPNFIIDAVAQRALSKTPLAYFEAEFRRHLRRYRPTNGNEENEYLPDEFGPRPEPNELKMTFRVLAGEGESSVAIRVPSSADRFGVGLLGEYLYTMLLAQAECSVDLASRDEDPPGALDAQGQIEVKIHVGLFDGASLLRLRPQRWAQIIADAIYAYTMKRTERISTHYRLSPRERGTDLEWDEWDGGEPNQRRVLRE